MHNDTIIIPTPTTSLDQEIARINEMDIEYVEELAFLMNLGGANPRQAVINFLTRFYDMLANPARHDITIALSFDPPAFVAFSDTPAYDVFYTYDHEYLNYAPYV